MTKRSLQERDNLQKVIWQIVPLVFLATASFGASKIEIKGSWVRGVPTASSVAAAYMIIENKGDKDERLIQVNSTASKYAEIHTTIVNEEGIAKMKKIETIDIPSGKSVELKPSGPHIMLIELKKPLKTGDKVELNLKFEKSGSVEVQALVKEKANHSTHH